MKLSGFKIAHQGIDINLIRACKLILPSILSNPKYIDSGFTFHALYKTKPNRFPSNIRLDDLAKNDIFIVSNPCADYIEMKNIMTNTSLWSFAASCFDRDEDDLVLSFMNITRKVARCGPSMSWHRDFANKMTSTACSENMLRVIVPLDECDSNNGTISIVPDSHIIKDKQLLNSDHEIDNEYCQRHAIYIEMKPGDMLGFSSKLIHGGGVNTSSKDRNYLIFQFTIKDSKHMYENKDEPFYHLGRREIMEI